MVAPEEVSLDSSTSLLCRSDLNQSLRYLNENKENELESELKYVGVLAGLCV